MKSLYIALAACKFKEIPLALPPDAGVEDLYHHAWLYSCILNSFMNKKTTSGNQTWILSLPPGQGSVFPLPSQGNDRSSCKGVL